VGPTMVAFLAQLGSSGYLDRSRGRSIERGYDGLRTVRGFTRCAGGGARRGRGSVRRVTIFQTSAPRTRRSGRSHAMRSPKLLARHTKVTGQAFETAGLWKSIFELGAGNPWADQRDGRPDSWRAMSPTARVEGHRGARRGPPRRRSSESGGRTSIRSSPATRAAGLQKILAPRSPGRSPEATSSMTLYRYVVA